MSNMTGKISQIMGAVVDVAFEDGHLPNICLLYTSPSPRD